MALPKIQYPTTSIKIPPTNKEYSFRPMLVKEEKILLVAKASEDETDILTAIKQVINNCCLDDRFDVDKIPLFALEYVFLKLRSISIGDQVKVSYRDFEDNKLYDFNVILSNVEIRYPENIEPKIQINENAGVIMTYPTANLYSDKEFLATVGEESAFKLIVKCIDKVYDAETVHEAKEFEEKDLMEFIELLDVQSFTKIRDFMSNIPSLYYKLEYTNENGNVRTIELTSLTDFFTLR
jgi:hypothetical protein